MLSASCFAASFRSVPPLTKQITTTDIQGQMILLGTGTSVGVPTIGCSCDVCQSSHPRNQRTRCSAILGLEQGNLLIDTPPDLRAQLLRERIGIVHAVIYTHQHADHLFGLDDLRLFPFYLGHAVPLYCESQVEELIRQAYSYAFEEREPTHPGARPQLEIIGISEDPFSVLGRTVIPIRLEHGPRFQVLGFRIGNVAYCTDASAIPDSSWPRLEGLDVLVLDALRWRPHPTHLNVKDAVAIAQRLGAKRTYFTHLSHELDYEQTMSQLPPNIELAYDGLKIELT